MLFPPTQPTRVKNISKYLGKKYGGIWTWVMSAVFNRVRATIYATTILIGDSTETELTV